MQKNAKWHRLSGRITTEIMKKTTDCAPGRALMKEDIHSHTHACRERNEGMEGKEDADDETAKVWVELG